jgi:hypothetical protein
MPPGQTPSLVQSREQNATPPRVRHASPAAQGLPPSGSQATPMSPLATKGSAAQTAAPLVPPEEEVDPPVVPPVLVPTVPEVPPVRPLVPPVVLAVVLVPEVVPVVAEPHSSAHSEGHSVVQRQEMTALYSLAPVAQFVSHAPRHVLSPGVHACPQLAKLWHPGSAVHVSMTFRQAVPG